MTNLVGENMSLLALMLYGLLILIYLVILRLMLDLLQHMGKKHDEPKFIVDVDIQRSKTAESENNMHTFDSYDLAIKIAKVGISVLGVTALIVLSVTKLGVLATIILIGIAILLIWLVQMIIRVVRHTRIIMAAQKMIKKGGGTGSILMLTIGLVAVLFVMALAG